MPFFQRNHEPFLAKASKGVPRTANGLEGSMHSCARPRRSLRGGGAGDEGRQEKAAGSSGQEWLLPLPAHEKGGSRGAAFKRGTDQCSYLEPVYTPLPLVSTTS